MQKDRTILELIDHLRSILDFKFLEIVDDWPSDLCAIGLKREGKLVYISTFNFADQNELKYDYDLELVDKLNKTQINVLKEGRGVLEEQLIEEIKGFLEA